MKTYEFNRKDFNWAEEYYDLIAEKMSLPKGSVNNADALYDTLTGFLETPCDIILTGFNKPENEYNGYVINLINGCFIDAEKDYPDRFKVIFKP